MKPVVLLARVAALALAAFLLGLALDTQPLALFAIAASSLFLLVVAIDYAPRAAGGRQRPDNVLEFVPARAPRSDKLAA